MYYSLVYILSIFALIPSNQETAFYTKVPNGIEYTVNGLKKRVLFYDDETVRITVVKENYNFTDSSLIVISKPKPVHFTINNAEHIQLVSNKIILSINKNTGNIRFSDSQRNVYISEHNKILPVLTDTVIENLNQYKIKQAFNLSDDQGIYGLGQYQLGYMNYQNKDVLMVQSNVNAVVPFLLSTSNFGILWDNYSETKFHDGVNETWFESEVADQIDYYFVTGSNMDNVISKYRHLTGKAPLFSKKTYGFWQSKERYKSFNELSDVVNKYRLNKIPLDNIVQDWKYWGTDFKYWNSMYFEPDSFPNPKQNIKKLHNQNVNLMVSIWPQMGTETELYKDLESIDALFSPETWTGGKVYDAFNPLARSIYWNYIQDGLISKGVDALWMDGTEPEFGGTDSQEKFLQGCAKVEHTSVGPISKYLNAYSLQTTSGAFLNHRNFTNDKRVFILTRSAFAGQQRNAAATWSGDIHADYNILKNQIIAGLNFSMSGIPYWTHDIGGFYPTTHNGMNSEGIHSPAYRELYARWFQFGAFTPIFRSHGTVTPRETWQFKELDPEVYKSLVKFTNLRYKLIDYIYSSAWQVTNKSYSLMRGLMMDFPEDKKTYEIGDQYMFGQSVLVKPVTKSMYYFPEEENVDIIPVDNLFSMNGKNGLQATYYKGGNFDEKVYEGTDAFINFNWNNESLPNGLTNSNFSVRWEGTIKPTESGKYKLAIFSDDKMSLWINDEKLITKEWSHEPEYSLVELEMTADKAYKIKLEYNKISVGFQIQLGWICPEYNSKINKTNTSKMVAVYLPDHVGWYDFWTNKFHHGNQVVQKESPIDILPIYIKAGSIIPMKPVQQYIGEKKNSPLEIRIYPGADSEFVYYEDEGDNYNYENGNFNTIQFKWDDTKGILNIGESSGDFKGFMIDKIFNIVVVENNKFKSEIINYNGDVLRINTSTF